RLYCRRLRTQILVDAGRYDDAIAECEALLKDYSNEAGKVRDIRATLSSVYSAARKLPHAEEQLEIILKQDPSDATANNDLGYIWADQGKKLLEAERLIRKAIDLDRQQRKGAAKVSPDSDRDNAAYIDSLGWVLFRRGQLPEARQQMEKAV